MIDKKLIEKKLRMIEKYISEIRTEPEVKQFKKFSDNVVFKRFVERNIELTIQLMIDICKHIVSRLNMTEPESYSDCFRILIERKIISRKYDSIYRNIVKYRNFIIHGYEKIDDTITYSIYKKRLSDFSKFVESIRYYLESEN